MAMSSIHRPRIRSVKLVNVEQVREKFDQRKRISQHMEDRYRQQCTGAYWRYVSGIHEACNSASAAILNPPFAYDPDDIALQPTQQVRATGPVPRITDRLAQYHEPCSDAIDVRSLQLPACIDALLETSIQEHARIPDGIRMNPVVVQLLRLLDCCHVHQGRNGEYVLYRGLIQLVPDPELDANTIGIDYL